MKVEIKQAHTAVLFAILFITVGWVAPAAYASYAPQENYITVHEFSAEDTTTQAESHLLCFDRTVKHPRTGKVFTELYLVSDDNKTVEVDSRTMERYFQKGHRSVETSMPLPNHLEPGEYKYTLVIKMELAQGRVEREFEFTSQPFNVTEGPANNTTTASFECGS